MALVIERDELGEVMLSSPVRVRIKVVRIGAERRKTKVAQERAEAAGASRLMSSIEVVSFEGMPDGEGFVGYLSDFPVRRATAGADGSWVFASPRGDVIRVSSLAEPLPRNLEAHLLDLGVLFAPSVPETSPYEYHQAFSDELTELLGRPVVVRKVRDAERWQFLADPEMTFDEQAKTLEFYRANYSRFHPPPPLLPPI